MLQTFPLFLGMFQRQLGYAQTASQESEYVSCSHGTWLECMFYWGSVKWTSLLGVFTEEDKKDEEKIFVEKEINTDPWPGYKYSGKLRPYYPLV